MDAEAVRELFKVRVPLQRCWVCGSPRSEAVSADDRYGMGMSYVICERCGLVYLDPVPGDEPLRIFYRDHYRRFYSQITAVNKWTAAGDRRLADYRYNAL